MATEKDVEALIRERSAAPGTLVEALHDVHDFVLAPSQRSAAVDVFPASRLAGSVGRLCRCRGMIQEVQPEVSLFCASTQHFFSPAPSTDGSPVDAVQFFDAVSLYVIPVPGNEHFYTLDGEPPTTEAAHSTTAAGQPHTDRKRRDRADGGDKDGPGPQVRDAGGRGEAKVRRTAGGVVEEDEGEVSVAADALAPGGPSLNFPHPPVHPQLQTACIVTVLLPPTSDGRRNPFRMNDVIDFYGFQHFPDDQLAVNEEDDFAHFSAWNAAELSKGLVSRLLCLAYTPISSVHLGPCAAVGEAPGWVAQQRASALQHLVAHVTYGDELAAEYLLLHLCAKVTMHSDALPVGDVPLLITGPNLCPEVWSRQVRRVTPVGELLVTSETLRRATPARLTPRYHNELNYLQSGLLQVANGSHVTVDCTAIGTRDAAWYEAMFALVHKQVLLLDYPYQTLELPVDVSVLALQPTAEPASALHPLFQFALWVRWQPAGPAAAVPPYTCTEDDAAHGSADAAATVRRYFTAVRHLPTETAALDGDVAAAASAALLEMSHALPGWNNRDPLLHNSSFSAATALMRAHAASWGRPNFAAEDIAAVRRLEALRVARLNGATGEGS